MYITRDEDLRAFCKRAKTSELLAVDTEFLREKSYHPQLCLIQLAFDGGICAVDPFAISDMSPLVELLEDCSIVKVIHSCSQDLEVIRYALGAHVAPVFDTQIAAAFLGFRMHLGYGRIVKAYCGVDLPKTESLTDWSMRPLCEEQLKYAEDDVLYLPDIYRQMVDQLIRKNRLSLLKPEMEELTHPSKFESCPRDVYRKIKRVNTLSRRQLAVAREVAEIRELKAQEQDIPRKWVFSDEVLIEICKRMPQDTERLRRMRGLDTLSESLLQQIIDAVNRVKIMSPEEYPHQFKKTTMTSETESVVDLMYAVLRIIADREGIASQMIATRDDLHDFYNQHESCKIMRGWRYELLGLPLKRLMRGEMGLTIKDGKVEFL